MDVNNVLEWVDQQNKLVTISVEQVQLSEMADWIYDRSRGRIYHCSGGFYSIEGISASVNGNTRWEQPIIQQNEYGVLGILAMKQHGDLYLLMQAKVEPGNVNYVQLSPTVQATKSNYTQIHKGRKPTYIEYFINAGKHSILYDSLQSEQGSRFLAKRNRNMIVMVDRETEIPLRDNFAWISLRDLKSLMKYDNIVNMDTRSVLSGLSPSLYSKVVNPATSLKQYSEFLLESLSSNIGRESIESIVSSLTNIKCRIDLERKIIPLHHLEKWQCDDNVIHYCESKYFSIIGTRVEIGNREVVSWCQPMLQPVCQGLCCFVYKRISGLIHFLVQMLVECGNLDTVEFAPTVQCLDEDYSKCNVADYPFLEEILHGKKNKPVYDALLSEEGGRFFRDQNRYMIVEATSDFPEEVPDFYLWMSLSQIHELLIHGNHFNVQARSLISVLPFHSGD